MARPRRPGGGAIGPARKPRPAKLSPPRLVRVIERRRLFALLDECLAHPAAWIVGPPGSGKTTLAASYLAGTRRPVLWYQVDPGDADIASFFHYFGQAIGHATRRVQVALPAFGPEHRPHAAGFARRYFRDAFTALPENVAVVIDNVQEGESEAFRTLLQSLVEEIPEGASVLFASREKPPDELTPAIARRLLAPLEARELAFTLAESTRFLAQRKLDTATVERIHHEADGWAAGVVLLGGQAEALAGAAPGQAPPAPASDALFAYFAGQAFEALPEAWRRFLMLSSLLPRVTPSAGDEIIGGVDSRNVLATLQNRHLFVDRRSAGEPTYQYHALFREFLRSRAQAAFTPAELRAFLHRAGTWFEERGARGEAIPLHIEARAFAAAAPLIAAKAESMLAQGRNLGLAQWIRQMPAAELEAHPELRYWLGHALIQVDEFAARAEFRGAFEGFARRGGDLGCLLAAAASLELAHSSFTSWEGVGEWLDAVPRYFGRVQSYPDASTELRAQSGYRLALHLRAESDDAEPLRTEERLFALLRDPAIDANAGLLTAGMLADLLDRLPDVEPRLDRFEAATRALVAKPGASALLRARFRQVIAFQFAKARRFEDAAEAFADAQAIRAREELGQMDLELAFYASAIAFSRRDLEACEAAASRLAGVHDPANPIHGIFLAITLAHVDFVRGAFDDAMAHCQEAIAQLQAVRAPPGEMPGIFVYLGCAHLALGNREAALAAFGEALERRSGYPRETTRCLIALARATEGPGDADDATLAEALALARQLGFVRMLSPIPAVASRLCARALHLGIEPEFVAKVIAFQQLEPESPFTEAWPWPVKIATLGTFAIEIGGKPGAATKAPKKPLELLKRVIAAGGRDVSTLHAMEHLWPELEGDAARSALGVALHRLRKLLGHEAAITLDAGQLALSATHCWVDAFAFEHHLAEAKAHAQAHRLAAFEASAAAAMALYAGHFLQGEPESAWQVGYRERLRSKQARLTTLLGRHWLAKGEPERALATYQKALELDPLAEEFYRQLMLVLVALGRPVEALTVYRRCREMLSVVLGAKPSPETDQVYRALRES